MIAWCVVFLPFDSVRESLPFDLPTTGICVVIPLHSTLKPQQVGFPLFTYEPGSRSGRDWPCRSDTSSLLLCRCTGHTPGPGLPHADSPASHHSWPGGLSLTPSLHPRAGPPEHHIPDRGCQPAAASCVTWVPGRGTPQSLCLSQPHGCPLLRTVPAFPNTWCTPCASKARAWGL